MILWLPPSRYRHGATVMLFSIAHAHAQAKPYKHLAWSEDLQHVCYIITILALVYYMINISDTMVNAL